MKSKLFLVLITFSVYSEVVFANCGPFNMFGDNDYCIACPNMHKKENSCPGGDVGMAAEGVLHPGCSISYWSSSCGGGATPFAAITDKEKMKNVTEGKANSTATSQVKNNPVTPGHASVSLDGDDYIVKMTKQDFNKLMKAKIK